MLSEIWAPLLIVTHIAINKVFPGMPETLSVNDLGGGGCGCRNGLTLLANQGKYFMDGQIEPGGGAEFTEMFVKVRSMLVKIRHALLATDRSDFVKLMWSGSQKKATEFLAAQKYHKGWYNRSQKLTASDVEGVCCHFAAVLFRLLLKGTLTSLGRLTSFRATAEERERGATFLRLVLSPKWGHKVRKRASGGTQVPKTKGAAALKKQKRKKSTTKLKKKKSTPKPKRKNGAPPKTTGKKKRKQKPSRKNK